MCALNSEPYQLSSTNRTPSLTHPSSVTFQLSELNLDLEDRLKKRSLRHQSQVKNESTKRSLKLFFKYKARSISELYDNCTPDEWAELIYTADTRIHQHLNTALELYTKEALTIQREDRWFWFCKQAKDIPEEVDELINLFAVQNISLIDFSNDVYKILREIDPKINTLRLIGTPNSGKTLIAQLLVSSFFSAYVNNHNSENEFYLSGFLNKAICVCEELMITPATAEDFKSILGGCKLDISKKYTNKQILTRTPIIVTSNHAKFGRGHLNPADEVALSIRCFTYHFNTQYKPKVKITPPALAYLIYCKCTDPNKNMYL